MLARRTLVTLVLAPASVQAAEWRVETAFGYGASFAPDAGPTAHLPWFGVGGGPVFDTRVVVHGRLRAPVVGMLGYGRMEGGLAVGWEPTVARADLGEIRLAVLPEVGYGYTVSDVAEGYLAGPDAVQFTGPYARAELALLWRIPSVVDTLDAVSLGLAVAGRHDWADHDHPRDAGRAGRFGFDAALVTNLGF
jgi:hypothetical protein